ncbi:MAG: hypothetical protein ACKO0V_19535, partial [bacterium]
EAVPTTDAMAKIVVRIAETYRHGDAFRYDLEFTGFEPGRYDLAKSLRRKNPEEKSAGILPIEVEVTSSLEPGRMEPSRPGGPEIPAWMTYFTKLNILIGVWILGLALLWGKSASQAQAVSRVEAPPMTLAERLKPLVQAACGGTLEAHQRAELEMLLIGYWSDRLELSGKTDPGALLQTLKQHPEAGPLVAKLEEWLHMPPDKRKLTEADITGLLQHYEKVTDSISGREINSRGGK